ncbi:hypothetical protein K435DRAFT_317025 [Dendrothele bispora CBS 962.96]|uniref:Uncharacterized protein n=1 Tax=Dendrothele bispora (strain CBS 962.96) TaxID=1314807 RepID=A0A4V4HAU9_DENBC|nr:hypothetical protein K435DRAFT_132365 [Dendrothele bispora CBS 962.96]THU88183.1 hypothetical protein K435DRAFT_317025 [Dendrothele bispora CBS 962.96]
MSHILTLKSLLRSCRVTSFPFVYAPVSLMSPIRLFPSRTPLLHTLFRPRLRAQSQYWVQVPRIITLHCLPRLASKPIRGLKSKVSRSTFPYNETSFHVISLCILSHLASSQLVHPQISLNSQISTNLTPSSVSDSSESALSSIGFRWRFARVLRLRFSNTNGRHRPGSRNQ